MEAARVFWSCSYINNHELLSDLFVTFPFNLYYIFTFPLYILCPLGIVFLLKFIRTNSSHESVGNEDSPRIATQILATLQSWRRGLTSSVSEVFETWFTKIFEERGFTFFLGWFLLFPIIFVLLLLFVAFFSPFFLLVLLFSFVFDSAFGIITTSTIHRGASHVPTFYASKTESDRFSRMVVFALFGVIFGGLHCFGWNLTYPTNIEKTLWRVTSLVITIIPFVVAHIDCVLENLQLSGRFGKQVRLGLDLLMTILLVIYVPTRLSLIGQAFALLRNQPLESLLAVDWTKYIPHIFS